MTDQSAKVLRQHEGKMRCQDRVAELEARIAAALKELDRLDTKWADPGWNGLIRSVVLGIVADLRTALNQGKEHG